MALISPEQLPDHAVSSVSAPLARIVQHRLIAQWRQQPERA